MFKLVKRNAYELILISVSLMYLIILLNPAHTIELMTMDIDEITERINQVRHVVYYEKPVDGVEKVVNSYGLPTDATGEFKTYMDYRTITNKNSKQWALQRLCETSAEGFRVFNNSYVVAMGTYYAQEVGKELVITLDTGIAINVIIGDIKQNAHTDANNQFIPKNGNIVEFIVDKEVIDSMVIKLGDVSVAGLGGKIISIEEEIQ